MKRTSTRTFFVTGSLSLAIAAFASTQATAAPAPHHSAANIKHLQQDAHTPQQYSILASYYTQQQQSYLHQAADEKQEWQRRSQITSGVYGKYPKPADQARNLYEYYTYKANQAATMSAKYTHLAAPGIEPKAE